MASTIFKIPTSLITRQHDNESDKSLPFYRTSFMRDRDRVMYSTAFRRLAGKTQIYTTGIDDHRKNRLTHSLEVSEIARTVAKALGLDCDLTEAIALGHDLGHTPFGHAGERMLHNIFSPGTKYIKQLRHVNLLKAQFERERRKDKTVEIPSFDKMFGFKHNIQSVRVACVIEDTYRDSTGKNIGLNLTNYTLWGILNHSKLKYDNNKISPVYYKQYQDHIAVKGTQSAAWSLEAYIVELSDSIAQWHHDLEDALRGEAIPLEKICETIKSALGENLFTKDKIKIDEIKSNKIADRKSIAELSHIVINTIVNDLVDTTLKNMNIIEEALMKKFENLTDDEISYKLYTEYDVLGLPLNKESIVSLSDGIKREKFGDVIRKLVHHSFDVERMNGKGEYIIRKLFEAYNNNPQQLPDGYVLHYMVDIGIFPNVDNAKTKGIGFVRTRFEQIIKNMNVVQRMMLMRRICDHIACMTDQYAIEEFRKLYR